MRGCGRRGTLEAARAPLVVLVAFILLGLYLEAAHRAAFYRGGYVRYHEEKYNLPLNPSKLSCQGYKGREELGESASIALLTVQVESGTRGWPRGGGEAQRLVQENHALYARLHNYTYYNERSLAPLARMPHGAALAAEARKSWVPAGERARLAACSKLHFARQRLAQHDALLLLDADVLIADLRRSVPQLLRDLSAARSDMVVAEDHTGLNCGLLLLRRGTWSESFLSEVTREYDGVGDPYHCRYKHMPEGAAARRAVAAMAAPRRCGVHIEDVFDNRLQAYFSLVHKNKLELKEVQFALHNVASTCKAEGPCLQHFLGVARALMAPYEPSQPVTAANATTDAPS